MKGKDVLVRGCYKFHVRKYHAQRKFANGTTSNNVAMRHNNSNLGGKTDERPCLSHVQWNSCLISVFIMYGAALCAK